MLLTRTNEYPPYIHYTILINRTDIQEQEIEYSLDTTAVSNPAALQFFCLKIKLLGK